MFRSMTTVPERLTAALHDRYRIERELGEGAMARVYLAHDLRHDRPVALKVLKPELAAAVGADRFLAEIKTTANLQHPHVLPLFDSGEADGFLFYAMPFVKGETLAERIEREGALPMGEAMAIAREVASALDHAHAHGIVHRDIKPANILLGEAGAFVADFGVALALAESDRARHTATGVSVGTPAYMSPEQLGTETDVDGRADVYGLAASLYEAVTGAPPFAASSVGALIGQVITAPTPDAHELRPEVPRRVARAIARGMARRREDRFSTARELHEACTETIASSTSRGRGRGAVLAVAAVLVLATAGIAWRSVQRSEARSRLPEIERLVLDGEYDQAFALARMSERWLPEDSSLTSLIAEASDVLTVTSEPPGARVFIQRFDPAAPLQPDSQAIGTTPVESHRLSRGSHRISVRLEGRVPVERILSTELARESESAPVAREIRLMARMVAAAEVPEGTVPVPGGAYALVSPDAPVGLAATLEPFFIDRVEVTNAAYGEFVRAGGYTGGEYWVDSPGADRTSFVDTTGLPGPRAWVGQRFPEGAARHPVAGVSWHEAQAFCRWQGRRLPTVMEWEKTARDGRSSSYGTVMPWGLQSRSGSGTVRANFSSSGPSDVDAHPFGVSPYGAYGMAGNVREWLANPMGAGYAITGGSWDGPSYLYTEYSAETGTFRSPALGFRCAVAEGEGDQGSRRIDLDSRTPTYTPVDEAEYRALLTHYAYDPRPANPRSTATEDFPAWTRERIWIDGVESDSVLLYFYAPRSAEPPYQTVVYVASSSAFATQTVPEEMEWALGPTIQSGRAVLAVVLYGMLERDFPAGYTVPDPPTVGFRDLMVRHATEMRMGMDYAVTRPDVAADQLAYLGVSFGAGSRMTLSAVDDRFKAIIYVGGGIDERVKPTLPEADNVNFAPYVRAPKLLLNGRHDEEHAWLTRALPLWNLLREPKELVLVDGAGHVVPLEARVPAINGFLDRTLGPVRGRATSR
jgi:serine/threonine protein kinase/formylglycine-generating enzyme required for sulfatase activity